MADPETRLVGLPDGSFVDAYIGYRQWLVRTNEGVVTLHPVGRMIAPAWIPNEINEAVCLCHDHDREARCGFHAWAALPRSVVLRPSHTWGEVYLWGDIEIHEKGYRAEYALTAGLYVFESMDSRTRRIVELAGLQYNVPIMMSDYTKVDRVYAR